MLIGHTHSSQFIERQNLGITTLKHATCAPNVYFVTISHRNYWHQINSWKNLWKFWNGPLCRNKSCPFPLLNIAGYWKSRNYQETVSDTCKQHWQWGQRNWSQNLCEVLQSAYFCCVHSQWKCQLKNLFHSEHTSQWVFCMLVKENLCDMWCYIWVWFCLHIYYWHFPKDFETVRVITCVCDSYIRVTELFVFIFEFIRVLYRWILTIQDV